MSLEHVELLLREELSRNVLLGLLLEAFHDFFGYFQFGESRKTGVLRNSLLQGEVLLSTLEASLLMKSQLAVRERVPIGALLGLRLQVIEQQHVRVFGAGALNDVVFCQVGILNLCLPR